MKFYVMFIFLLVGISALTVRKRPKIIIQANYNGGRGYSIIFKRKLLFELKDRLEEALKGKVKVKVLMKNLSIAENFEQEFNRNYVEDSLIVSAEDNQPMINHEEFNILISLNNGDTLRLIATSDPNDKVNYYEYLQTGVGRGKRDLTLESIIGTVKAIMHH